MLEIDGSLGEGGGQVLRTSLALSLWTGAPFRIVRIRAGRRKPGLRPQHCTALLAAAAVGGAEVEGAAIGSTEAVFRPGPVRAGDYRFDIGTAGATGLVLQTVLLPLLRADAPSRLVLTGGTHNPLSPPFDFLDRAWLPLLRRMGIRATFSLEEPGFHPAGGGRITAEIEPSPILAPLELPERGEIRALRATALVSHLPEHVAERELRVLRGELGVAAGDCEAVPIAARGPGNALILEIECAEVTEVFTGIGEKGVRAEIVASRVAGEARRWLDAGVPVGPHLADQLILPMALGRGGSFRSVAPTLHLLTCAEIVRRFLPAAEIGIRHEPGGTARIEIAPGEGR